MLQVTDQDSLALIRDVEDSAPIDVKIGEAISTLWQGESREYTKLLPVKRRPSSHMFTSDKRYGSSFFFDGHMSTFVITGEKAYKP